LCERANIFACLYKGSIYTYLKGKAVLKINFIGGKRREDICIYLVQFATMLSMFS